MYISFVFYLWNHKNPYRPFEWTFTEMLMCPSHAPTKSLLALLSWMFFTHSLLKDFWNEKILLRTLCTYWSKHNNLSNHWINRKFVNFSLWEHSQAHTIVRCNIIRFHFNNYIYLYVKILEWEGAYVCRDMSQDFIVFIKIFIMSHI